MLLLRHDILHICSHQVSKKQFNETGMQIPFSECTKCHMVVGEEPPTRKWIWIISNNIICHNTLLAQLCWLSSCSIHFLSHGFNYNIHKKSIQIIPLILFFLSRFNFKSSTENLNCLHCNSHNHLTRHALNIFSQGSTLLYIPISVWSSIIFLIYLMPYNLCHS